MADKPAKLSIGPRHFSKVKAARELLRSKAEELLNLQIAIIKQSAAAGDYESSTKALQWLLEHIPEEDGERVVDISVDKPKQVEAPRGPSISIGFALGGINQPKPLDPVIEVEKLPDDTK